MNKPPAGDFQNIGNTVMPEAVGDNLTTTANANNPPAP